MRDLRCMTAVYITQGSRVLLLYRRGGRVVNEVWTGTAGGHFEPAELNDPRACVLRELREETGLAEEDLEGLALRYITLRRVKGEIRENFYFFASLRGNRKIASNEGDLRWFDFRDLPGLPMPYSAKFVLEHYLTVGAWERQIYVGAADGERVAFAALPEY